MKHIAHELLRIKAVALRPNEPFTWASGIKSPIYCDNRLTMSFPNARRMIATALAETIKLTYPDVEVIAGTATAGIPHAAWVAELLNLPMVYIRGKAKDHGKQNQIEGQIKEGQKMVIIEDLISTGGSVLEACQAAKKEGAVVLGVAAIFTYELPEGASNFSKQNIPYLTLTNYSELIKVAKDNEFIEEDDVIVLQDWKKDPANWKNIN